MRISELSRLTGVSMRSLRHYEHKGLIKPQRLGNGYRDYDESMIERIRAIKLYLGLGLTTDEIGKLFTCKGLGMLGDWDVKQQECGDNLLTLYQQKVQAIDAERQVLDDIKVRLLERMSLIENKKKKPFC
jgi:MerR family Zn(II)-responsive transcriptional regulator of zntA